MARASDVNDGADRTTMTGWVQRVIALPHYPWLDQSQAFDTAIYDSGWSVLIQDVLRELDGVMGSTSVHLVLFQVKAKVGTLRFRYRLPDASDNVRAAVADICERALERSNRICIECAAPAEAGWQGDWRGPLCRFHAK